MSSYFCPPNYNTLVSVMSVPCVTNLSKRHSRSTSSACKLPVYCFHTQLAQAATVTCASHVWLTNRVGSRRICDFVRDSHVAHMGEKRGTYRALVGKPEGRRPLERPRHRWEDDIKMDLRKMGLEACTGSMWLRIGTGGGLL